MPAKHGLNPQQIEILRSTMAPFAAEIECVGVFGSRATGEAKPYSDIDLVLYGTLNQQQLDRIFTLLNDSSLPMKADVHAYHLIDYAPLKSHIDDVMQPLFTKEQLQRTEQT